MKKLFGILLALSFASCHIPAASAAPQAASASKSATLQPGELAVYNQIRSLMVLPEVAPLKSYITSMQSKKYSQAFYVKVLELIYSNGIFKVAELIALSNQGLKHYPECGKLYFYRGAGWCNADESEEAQADLLTSIKTDPDNAEAFYKLAQCHQNLLQLDKAKVCIERAIKINPTNAFYADLKGEICKALHEPGPAIAAFNDAARLAQLSLKWKFRGHLANYYTQLKRYPEAITTYKTQLIDAGANPRLVAEINGRIGKCLVILQNYKEALPYLDKSLNLVSDDQVRESRIKALSAMGYESRAKKESDALRQSQQEMHPPK